MAYLTDAQRSYYESQIAKGADKYANDYAKANDSAYDFMTKKNFNKYKNDYANLEKKIQADDAVKSVEDTEGTRNLGKDITAKQASQDSASTSLSSQSSLLNSGLSKSQVANIGASTLSSNAVENYNNNVEDNINAVHNAKVNQAQSLLQAIGELDSANNLLSAQDSMNEAENWSTLANILSVIGGVL